LRDGRVVYSKARSGCGFAPEDISFQSRSNSWFTSVAKARLLGFQALHVGEGVGVEVLQPGRERLLDLLAGNPFEDRDIGVDVDFEPHGGPLRNRACSLSRGRVNFFRFRTF